MADERISQLTELTTPAINDKIPIVDVSDPTMGPGGTTKYIEPQTLFDSFSPALTLQEAYNNSVPDTDLILLQDAVGGAFTIRHSATTAANNITFALYDPSNLLNFSVQQSGLVTLPKLAGTLGRVLTLSTGGAIEADTAFRWNGSTLDLDGDLDMTGDIRADGLIDAAGGTFTGAVDVFNNAPQMVIQGVATGAANTAVTHYRDQLGTLQAVVGYELGDAILRHNTTGQAIILDGAGGSDGLEFDDGTNPPWFVWHEGNLNPAIFGDVFLTGTPANNQLAVWTNANTIEGAATLTFDGTDLAVIGGDLVASQLRASTLSLVDASSWASFPGVNYYGVAEGASGRRWLTGLTGTDFRFGYQDSAQTSGTLGTYTTLYTLHSSGTPTNGTDLLTKAYGDATYSGGGGTIGGTIAATQVAYGSGADTITGSSVLTFAANKLVLDDGTNNTAFEVQRTVTAVDYTAQLTLDGSGNGTLISSNGTNSPSFRVRAATDDFTWLSQAGGTIMSLTSAGVLSTDGQINTSGNEIQITGASPRIDFVETGGSNNWNLIVDSDVLTMRLNGTSDTLFSFSNTELLSYRNVSLSVANDTADAVLRDVNFYNTSNTDGDKRMGIIRARNYDGASGTRGGYFQFVTRRKNTALSFDFPMEIYGDRVALGSSVTSFYAADAAAHFNDVRCDDVMRWDVSFANNAHQRADARIDATNFARLHWYGVSDGGSTSNFRHAWYDGSAYIDVTAENGGVTFESADAGGATYTFTSPSTTLATINIGTSGATNGSLNWAKADSGGITAAWNGNNLRYRRGGGGTVTGWEWSNFDTTVATLTTGGQMTVRNIVIENLASTFITHNAQNTRDKIRVWNSSLYTIGMTPSQTYGPLNNDYAMTFQMNNDPDRGWWWGDDAHSNAQGAMALRTDGRLTVASYTRIGYGESDTTIPGTTYMLQVNGSIQASNFVLSSDQRAKQMITDHIAHRYQVGWRTFEFKDMPGEIRYGVVAQELERHHPQFVTTDESGRKSVKYIDLLVAKVAELEHRLAVAERNLKIA